jgi:radical SAM protein with 4Fe4S-binding SPASM domain
MNKNIRENNYFCARLFKSLTIFQDGQVSPCCISEYDSEKYNVGKITLEEIWENSDFNNFRNAVLNNEPLEMCNRCYRLEELKMPSFRELANKSLVVNDEEISEAALNKGRLPLASLTDLNLRLSNVCDYKCRMCRPEDSSSWISDAKTIEPYKKIGIIKLNEISTTFKSSFIKLIPQLESIYFAGGEPLISPEHFEILDLLTPYAHKITLDYNTNLTTLTFRNYNLIEKWKTFKFVKLGISLDGSGAQVELIRKGINYDNIIRLQKILSSQGGNIFQYIFVTISVLNLFHLPDAIDNWIENKLVIWPDQLVLNYLTEPRHLNPNILNENERNLLKDKYENYLLLRKSTLNRISYMMVERTLKYALSTLTEPVWEKERFDFSVWTKQMDTLRKEETDIVLPELKTLMFS